MYRFVPISRFGEREWKIIGELSSQGGLTNFADIEGDADRQEVSTALPLVEILKNADLSRISRYTNRFDRVLVDTPLFHPDNVFSDEEMLHNAEFHNSNTDANTIPVISHKRTDDGLIEYGPMLDGLKKLSEKFETVAIRPIVGTAEFTPRQKTELKQIADQLSSGDIVLPDIWDIEQGLGPVYLNIQTMCDIFSDVETYILNAFDPNNGGNEAHNYGPLFASMVPAQGFGDYLLERRKMPPGPVTTSNRVIRYYDESEFKRIRISGEGYSGAARNLKETGYLDETHCTYCRRAVQSNETGRGFWKEFQMGHYVQSAVSHISDLEEYSGQDLDMDGFSTLRKHLGDNDGD